MNGSEPEAKLWSKDFIIIASANFFVALTFYMLMTTIAVYATEQFRASQSAAGFASGVFIIGALCSRLLAGKYLEIIGRKKLLYGSAAVFFAATLLYFPTYDLNVLLAVRFIHGAAFGVAATALSTIAVSMIPKHRRGEGIGYYTLSSTAATAIGPFLGLLITQHADFTFVFASCTAFSVATMAIVLFADIREADLTAEQRASLRSGFKLSNYFEARAVPISVMMIIMGISYSGIVSFLNSYAIEIGLTEAASYYFLVYAAFIFISRPFAGKLLDRKGDNIVLYPSILIFSCSLLVLSQAEHGFTMLLAGALGALGFGTLMSSAQAIAVKRSPKHRVGLATSTFFIFTDGGMGIGPLLIGMIIPRAGFRGMYVTLAAVVFLSIALYYVLHGKRASIAPEPEHFQLQWQAGKE